MTGDLQDSQSEPPIIAQQLKDEMQKLLGDNLTEEEERELELILTGDESALKYFLLRCEVGPLSLPAKSYFY